MLESTLGISFKMEDLLLGSRLMVEENCQVMEPNGIRIQL